MLRSFGSKSGQGGAPAPKSSSTSSSVFKGFGKEPEKQKPSTTEALLTSLGGAPSLWPVAVAVRLLLPMCGQHVSGSNLLVQVGV